MSVVGQEPATPKTNHYFDPSSLEDLTARAPLATLQNELEECRDGIVQDTYEVFGQRLGREHEPALRSLTRDPERYRDYIPRVLSIVGRLSDDEQYDLGLVEDRVRDIDFILGEISVRRELLLLEEAAEEATPSFSLTPSALFTNNPAAEYVIAVVKNRGLPSSDAALGLA